MGWSEVITAVRIGSTVLCGNRKGVERNVSSKPNLYKTDKYEPDKTLLVPIKDSQWPFSSVQT